jgi:putative spermidine/putrescine transport system ATP-binding protein
VAIARAIVYEPGVLLMDEPLGALDRRLRADMQLEIKSLHEQLGITIVYVTHYQDEALSMSDRVVVFNKGRIEQVGAPRAVYRNPSTVLVADFFGDSLSISAVVRGRQAQLDIVETTIELPGTQARAGGVRLLWCSDQTAICDPVDQVRQDGAILIVPATVLTSAYGGNVVHGHRTDIGLWRQCRAAARPPGDGRCRNNHGRRGLDGRDRCSDRGRAGLVGCDVPGRRQGGGGRQVTETAQER